MWTVMIVVDTSGVGDLAFAADHGSPAGCPCYRLFPENGTKLNHGASLLVQAPFGVTLGWVVLVGTVAATSVSVMAAPATTAFLDDADNAPAFHPADRTRLHDLDFIADLGFVLFVVSVHHGLTIDHLLR